MRRKPKPLQGPHRSLDDMLDEPDVKAWLDRAVTEMFPKMQGSVMSLIVGAEHPDAKLALEVGAAVLLDKPLLIIIPRGAKFSNTLRSVATEVVEIDDMKDPASQAAVRAAIELVLRARS